MDPEFKEHATEKLLGEGDRRNSEGEDDFTSNKPRRKVHIVDSNQPFSASLNAEDIARESKDSLHDGEDNSNGFLGEERKQSGTHIVPTKSSLREQTVLKSRRRRQAPKKTIWNELIDLIVFCYEFILIMAVIASGSLLASIPCSIYVIISLFYLGLQIVIENRKVSNRICMILMGTMLVVSIAFLIFKIIFSILISKGTVSSNESEQRLHRSLGISITNEEDGGSAWRIVQTFLSDVVALIVSLLLFIGCIIKNKGSSEEAEDHKLENLKVTGSQSPEFWICIVLFFLLLAGIISPSLIALTFVLMSCVALMSWALHYELNGPIMSVITYLCTFIAAVYITASFIIQIPLINNSNPSWVDWVGLDNFSQENISWRDNLSGYSITVGVYITALIYRKAAYRHAQKERYLRQRYPERYVHVGFGRGKFTDVTRKKKTSLWESILYNTKVIVKNPYAHLMVFRVCLFLWFFIWFTFQSLVPMFMFWHSIIFVKRKGYIKALMYRGSFILKQYKLIIIINN